MKTFLTSVPISSLPQQKPGGSRCEAPDYLHKAMVSKCPFFSFMAVLLLMSCILLSFSSAQAHGKVMSSKTPQGSYVCMWPYVHLSLLLISAPTLDTLITTDCCIAGNNGSRHNLIFIRTPSISSPYSPDDLSPHRRCRSASRHLHTYHRLFCRHSRLTMDSEKGGHQ